MLEHASLLMHAWTQLAEPNRSSAWVRCITDAAGQPLGFARLQLAPHGTWFAWLRKVRLDVFETDDASHLMSLTRSWGILRSWRVNDAEDQHVGTVYAHSVITSEGQRLGCTERGRLLDAAGQPLACFGKKADALEVTFAPPPNPFLRMLVLGCALTRGPVPNR